MHFRSLMSVGRAVTCLLLVALSLPAQTTPADWDAWDDQIQEADALGQANEYDKAEALYKSLLAGLKRRTSPADRELSAIAWNNLGWLYMGRLDLRSAEPCLRNAIRIWEKLAGPDDEWLAQPLDNLGQVLAERGRFRQAEAMLRRALVLVRDQTKLAGILNSLALIRQAVGDDQQAFDLLRRAHAILQRLPAAEVRLETATVRFNLGDLYLTRKRFSEAEPHLRAGAAIWRAEFGENHPSYADGLFGIARLHVGRRDYRSAEPLLRNALSILEQTLGPAHPKLAEILEVYGEIERKNGRKAEADSHRKRARALRESDARASFTRHSIDVSELVRGR